MTPNMELRVLTALLTRDELIPTLELIDIVWTRAGYTEPKTARQILRNTICRLRDVGFRIESSRRKNGHAGFRLSRTIPDDPTLRAMLERAW